MYLTENLLFAIVLVAGLLPLLALAPGRGRVQVHLLGLGSLLLIVVGAAAHRPERDAELERALPAPTDRDGMRSSSTCAGCHPGQHATWQASFHRTMTQVAGPQSVVAPFDGRRLERQGRAFQVDRVSDEFWVTEVDTGSGLASSEAGVAKRVVMLPWVWEIADRMWIPTEDSFLRPADWTQYETVWNRDCIRCHSAGPLPEADAASPRWDTQVTELGIACAACHGPAEEHIRKHHNPLVRHLDRARGGPDPTIVNPRRLPAARSAEVCGQCHAHASFKADGFLGETWRAFRAGKKLEDHFTLSVHMGAESESSFWPDGADRIGGREFNSMALSGCYRKGEMSCLSCHTMHGAEPRDQLRLAMDGDEACLQCHEKFRSRLAEHTFHKPESSGSRCLACHMPYASYALLGTARLHRIDSPVASGATTSDRPNACNVCHLDRTLAWTSEYLGKWYRTPAAELDAEHREVAATVLWALKGDAAQRAIVAWHMGQGWALEVAGRDWVTPYLSNLLDDPYSAIRLIAHRSLRGIGGEAPIPFDYTAPAEARRRTAQAYMRR